MTDQKKPDRGRFVADGDRIVLLYDDGRIEPATKGHPGDERAKGADSVPFKSVPMDEIDDSHPPKEKQPFVDMAAANDLVEGWMDWPSRPGKRSYTIEVCVDHLDEDAVSRFVEAVGRSWTEAKPRKDGQFGVAYTWTGLTTGEARALAKAAGIQLPGED